VVPFVKFESVYEPLPPAVKSAETVRVATELPDVADAGYELVSLLMITPARSVSPGLVQLSASWVSPLVMLKLETAEGAVVSTQKGPRVSAW
jgi:hypothetical protein